MVNAAAYHNGQNVAELTDVGFNNVDEVIARLATMLPEDIPDPWGGTLEDYKECLAKISEGVTKIYESL